MLKPPPLSLSDFEGFADWVELSTLMNLGSTSRAEASDVLRDEDLLGLAPTDFFVGDVTYRDPNGFSDEDAAGEFIEGVWQILEDRRILLSAVYPFEINGDLLIRKSDAWSNHLCYTTLLLAEICQKYDRNLAKQPFPRLFEKLVEASATGLFGGKAARFGVPRESHWPVSIESRVQKLGELFTLETEALTGKLGARDGDRGLDVVSRLRIGDDGPGTLVLLLQCATGRNWQKKTGEPSLENWRDVLRWNATLLRALAVPWRLDNKERIRAFRRFEAIIIDRFRLLAGFPDEHLGESARRSLTSWCQSRLAELPRLN